MTARTLCVAASLFGATVGACLPTASDKSEASEQPAADISAETASPAADVPLEIAINQFPGGYQGRWARTADACADDPENSENLMSLQGKLVKFHESIGTMTAGKRLTSRTMEAEFEFVGEGEKWNRTMAFAMSPDLDRLTRTDLSDGTKVQYVQCPKLMAG